MSFLGVVASGAIVTLITAALALAIAAGLMTAKHIGHLTVSDIIEELKKYKRVKQEDNENRVGFVLKEIIASGAYKIVVGIWDKKANEIKAGTVFEAETVDEELKNADELVIFN